ncbi:hypothetical protein Tco_1351944 [Tanacetum coccineum]
MTRTFRRVYVCLRALKQGFRACGREILRLDGCFMSGPWPGLIQAIASVFPSAEHSYCVRHIYENMKSQFKGGVYKEMLWNAVKATSVGEFNKKMAELKSFNSAAYDWLMKIPAEQWSRAHFSGRAKCDILLNNILVRKVIAKTVGPLTPSVTKLFDAIKKATKKWELTGIPCKHVVAAIYNMSENSVGVAIPEQWVHAAYRLETWAYVYSFKVNPFGRPPKKRKKSHDEIANESCSSGKLSRKGKSDRCGKCGNVGHNRKGCRGQGGATQAGSSSARNVSGQGGARRTAIARNVSGQASARQAAGARTVSGQAGGASNVSSQSGGSSQPIAAQSTSTGARNASSQPSAAPSTASQGPTHHSAGPRQGFQAPRPGFSTQRLTKAIASRHSPRKLSS